MGPLTSTRYADQKKRRVPPCVGPLTSTRYADKKKRRVPPRVGPLAPKISLFVFFVSRHAPGLPVFFVSSHALGLPVFFVSGHAPGLPVFFVSSHAPGLPVFFVRTPCFTRILAENTATRTSQFQIKILRNSGTPNSPTRASGNGESLVSGVPVSFHIPKIHHEILKRGFL